MTSRMRTVIERAGLLGLALPGLVLAHFLTYLLAVTGRAARHQFLIDTGHSYWRDAVAASLVLGLAGTAARVAASLRYPSAVGAQGPSAGPLGLAGVQIGLFMAMEVGERLLAGVNLSSLLVHGAIPIGILLQFLTAFLVNLAVRAMTSAVGLFLRPRKPRPPRATAPLRPFLPAPALSAPALLVGGWGLRGPPRL